MPYPKGPKIIHNGNVPKQSSFESFLDLHGIAQGLLYLKLRLLLHCLESKRCDLGLRIVVALRDFYLLLVCLDIGRSTVLRSQRVPPSWCRMASAGFTNSSKALTRETPPSDSYLRVASDTGQAIVYCTFPRSTANWHYLSWETGTHSVSSQFEE